MKAEKYTDVVAYIFSLCFIVAGVLVSLNRFWQYEVFYYDFGIFDSAIWEVSRFRAPIIEHFVIGGKWIFADHFSPSIFLLTPFFWITQRSEILLVVQAIVVGVSGMVLYNIGINVIKNRLLSLSILICYFLFTGLQNAVITDFHELTIMTLPLMLTFWALLRKKVVLFYIFLIITLGFKEVTFLLGIGIGISILFINRGWFKIGLITILLSSLWGIISIKIIIPYFSGGIYIYDVPLPSGFVDKVYAFVDNPTKQKTLFYSFLSFGYLPIISPSFWFLIVQDYALRFIPFNFNTRWDLGLHYNAQSAVILALASIFSFRVLKKILNLRTLSFFALMLIVSAIFLYRFVLHGPFALAYNPAFYKHTSDFKFLDSMIDKVPKEATVMTHNNLAVRFTHQKVWLLRQNYSYYKPDYILIDLRSGQNPNNFYGTDNYASIAAQLKIDPNYSLLYHTESQFVFKIRAEKNKSQL